MKYIVLFLFSINLFAAVNWKDYTEKPDKPIFLYLYSGDFSDDSIQKTLDDKNVSKLINENFYPIKINSTERPDLVSRYVYVKLPSFAILLEDGRVASQGRNTSPINMQRELLSFLESLKTQKDYDEMIKNSNILMQQRLLFSYFTENSNQIENKSNLITIKLKEIFDFKIGGIKVGFKSVLPYFLYSAVTMGNELFELKWMSELQIDEMLKSKIFNKNHIFTSSKGNWNNPDLFVKFKTNVLFAQTLIHLYEKTKQKPYLENAKEILTFLKAEMNSIPYIFDSKKAEIKYEFDFVEYYVASLKYQYIQNENNTETIKEFRDFLDKLSKKEIIYLNQYSILLKGYTFLYKFSSDNADLLKAQENADEIVSKFYDYDKSIFYDVVNGKEPFGYKFVNIEDNIELALNYIHFSVMSKKYVYMLLSETILSFMNSIHQDSLIDTFYLLTIDKFKKYSDSFESITSTEMLEF